MFFGCGIWSPTVAQTGHNQLRLKFFHHCVATSEIPSNARNCVACAQGGSSLFLAWNQTTPIRPNGIPLRSLQNHLVSLTSFAKRQIGPSFEQIALHRGVYHSADVPWPMEPQAGAQLLWPKDLFGEGGRSPWVLGRAKMTFLTAACPGREAWWMDQRVPRWRTQGADFWCRQFRLAGDVRVCGSHFWIFVVL